MIWQCHNNIFCCEILVPFVKTELPQQMSQLFLATKAVNAVCYKLIANKIVDVYFLMQILQQEMHFQPTKQPQSNSNVTKMKHSQTKDGMGWKRSHKARKCLVSSSDGQQTSAIKTTYKSYNCTREVNNKILQFKEFKHAIIEHVTKILQQQKVVLTDIHLQA